MKKLLLLMFLATPLVAQVSPQIQGAGAPSNPCFNGGQQYVDQTNHVIYLCPSNGSNWVNVGLGNLTGAVKASTIVGPNFVLANGGTNVFSALASAGAQIHVTGNVTQTVATTISNSNVEIICDLGTQIQQQTAATDLFDVTSPTGFTLRGCLLDGNSGTATGKIVYIEGASGTNDVVTDRNTVQNWGSNGATGALFMTEGGKNWVFSNNRCIACLDGVYKIHNSNAAPVNQEALNNYIEDTATNAAAFRYLTDVTGNPFENVTALDNDFRVGTGAALSCGTGSGSLASAQETIMFNQFNGAGTAQISMVACNAMNNSTFGFNQFFANSKALQVGFALGDCVNCTIIGNYLNMTHTALEGIKMLDFGGASNGISGGVVAGNSVQDLPSNGSSPIDFAFWWDVSTNTQVGQYVIEGNSCQFSTGQTPAGSPLPSCYRIAESVASKTSQDIIFVGNFGQGPGTGGVGSNGLLVDDTGASGVQKNLLIADNYFTNFTNGINIGASVQAAFLESNLCLGTCTTPISINNTAGQTNLNNTHNAQQLTLTTGAVTFTFLQKFSTANGYNCAASDETTPANAVTFGTKTATSVPITGTGSDVVFLRCDGY